MIKFFLMGIVVIVAALGLGLGIQHVMALGDSYDCNFNLGGNHHHDHNNCCEIVGMTTADKSS